MYPLLKIWVRLALKFYCRNLFLNFHNHPEQPLILACNHPNSFLDALIIGSHYNKTIHFLARGDAFSKPLVRRLLKSMNMIPVYRITEGREQLKNNEASFNACLEVLKKNGTILIFSEGVCKNEWTLRPLKKGTARLARMAFYDKGIKDLLILPLSLSYSSFTSLSVAVYVKEGEAITNEDLTAKESSLFYRQFNALLHQRLQSNLLSKNQIEKLSVSNKLSKRLALCVPAFIGWLIHKGFYNACKNFAAHKTSGTVFYHSVLFALLLISYPVVLLLITAIVVLLTNNYYLWLLLVLSPFTAWCYKEYKS